MSELFNKHELDIADIRKRCESSIRNTPVGVHLGKCLDEIERLRKRVDDLEGDLSMLAEFAVSRHHIGRVKAIGLREACQAAIEIIQDHENRLACSIERQERSGQEWQK